MLLCLFCCENQSYPAEPSEDRAAATSEDTDKDKDKDKEKVGFTPAARLVRRPVAPCRSLGSADVLPFMSSP